jgi:hypothetical protein
MRPGIVEQFQLHGFEWGGTWRRPDGRHFEFVALERLGTAVPSVARA